MTKILFRATGLLIMLGTFAACEKNNEANKRYTSTMGASIDGTEVTLSGSIISPLSPGDVTETYFLLSEDKSVPEAGSVRIDGVRPGSGDAQFTGKVTDFKFGSNYYYKSVVVADGKTHGGNVRSFHFDVIPIERLQFEKDLFYFKINAYSPAVRLKVTPENATYRKQISISSSNTSVATVDSRTCAVTIRDWGTTEITARDTKSEIYATCKVKVMAAYPPSGAVDMGLSVYWGQRNLGADYDYQPGYHYSFGETTPKTSYSERDYTFPKFENGVLTKANDPAQSKGGHWRMPTARECKELIANCTVTLGKHSSSGRYYAKVRSNINGNEIWLPLNGNYSPMYGGLLEDDNIYLTVFTADGEHLYSRRINSESKPGDEVKLFCNGFGSGVYGRGVRPVTD